MNRMTLKQLEAFYWAATCESFAIAADKLHISQSSLSKRLVELETGIGQTLFNRDARRASLTADGRTLLPKARALLSHAEEVAASIGASGTIRGRFRLGVGEITASSWMPKLVSTLKERHPQLKLEPYVGLGLELEAKLLSGKLDAAIVARPSTSPALDSVLLAKAEYVWVAGRETIRPGQTAEDMVADMPVITMSQQAGSTLIFDAWRKESGATVCEIIESNSMATMAGLVSAGIGIGYLPSGWLRPMLRRGTLVVVPTKTPLQPVDYRFYWRGDDSRAVTSTLREVALEVVDYDESLLML